MNIKEEPHQIKNRNEIKNEQNEMRKERKNTKKSVPSWNGVCRESRVATHWCIKLNLLFGNNAHKKSEKEQRNSKNNHDKNPGGLFWWKLKLNLNLKLKHMAVKENGEKLRFMRVVANSSLLFSLVLVLKMMKNATKFPFAYSFETSMEIVEIIFARTVYVIRERCGCFLSLFMASESAWLLTTVVFVHKSKGKNC